MEIKIPAAIQQSVFAPIQESSEEIYWVGKPHFLPFLTSGFFFLLFGLAWGSFDYFIFIRNIGSFPRNGGFPIEYFFAIHLAPCYLAVANMLRLSLVYKNVYYAISNKRVLFRGGFWGLAFETIDYDKIQDLQVTVNAVESTCGCGTIKIFAGQFTSKGAPVSNNFVGIDDPYGCFKKLKEVSVNIKTDWNYPNALRPEDNPGYKSKYTGNK
jgi:hypothetical protein